MLRVLATDMGFGEVVMKKWQYVLTLFAFMGIFLLAKPGNVYADSDLETPQPQVVDNVVIDQTNESGTTGSSSIHEEEVASPSDGEEEDTNVSDGESLAEDKGENNNEEEMEEVEDVGEAETSPVNEPLLTSSSPTQSSSETSSTYGKTLDSGTYVITPKTDGFKAIDAGTSMVEPGSGIKINSADGTRGQKFSVIWNEAGYYTFKNVETGYCLGIAATDSPAGSPILQLKENAEDESQKWYIEADENGSYRIISKVNGRAITVPTDGRLLQLGDLASTDAEFFKFLVSGESTDFSNSVYEIACSGNENMVLDIYEGGMSPKSTVQIYNRNGTDAQKYILSYVRNDMWSITSLNSGHVLAVKDNNKSNGADIWQYTNSNTLSQRWYLRNTGDGTSYIVSALNPENGFTVSGIYANNTNIYNGTLNGRSAQKFVFNSVNYKPPKTGEYVVCSRLDNNFVLDIDKSCRQIQGNLQIYRNNGGLAQKFIITDLGNGFVTIMNANSGHLLDVQSGSKKTNANIWQYKENGSAAQRWIVHKNPNGSYSFINANSGMAMTVACSFAEDYTNVVQYPYQDLRTQEFTLSGTSGINNAAKDYSRYYDPADQKAQWEDSSTNYVMILDKQTHLLSIYTGPKGNRVRITRFLISDGAPSTPTPTGRFSIIGRVGSFGSGYTCWYATNFYGNYFFHSVIYAPGSKSEIYDGRLGMCISHGCVRAKINCAKWIYDYMPNGTRVYIY